VSKKLGLLNKNKKMFSRSTLVQLYKQTILPVIDYGSVLYDGISLNLINKIEKLQRRAAIICTGAISRTETVKLLQDLGWSTLERRRLKLKLTYFYKIYVTATPPYLNADLLKLLGNSKNTRFTRQQQSGKLKTPFCRTSKFKNSFFPFIISEWNKILNDMIEIDSLAKFKKFLNSKFELDQTGFDYNTVSGPATRILTQMRLGLSSLQGQLFCYNLIENPFCQNCLTDIESLEHYLFECSKYKDNRERFINRLSLFLPDVKNYSKIDLASFCVAGCSEYDYDTNYNIMQSTINFIIETKRFETN
jgi:hypothetical protein